MSQQITRHSLALPGPLVSPQWLAQRLGASGLRVLDASIGAHRGGACRIPGARPFDIDEALSDPDSPLPHTMPGPEQFTEIARGLGINESDTVVVYDNAGIYSSPRAWWMLRAMGFDAVAVLDGGFPAWTDAELPREDNASAPLGSRGDFTARPRPEMIVTADTVDASLAAPDTTVVDARSAERFRGTVPEPRPGLRSGHMPGAVNLPFSDLLRDGKMLPEADLRAAFADVARGRQRFIFSCGSGVTACVPALGAALAGYQELAVYDGSWSEWGLPSERPVITGDAPGERQL